MLKLVLVASVGAAFAIPATATAVATAKIYLEDTVPAGSSSSVTIQTRTKPAFRVLLRVPTQGRAKLYLLGKAAPKGGPLIDTKTYGCEGAAGSFYCKASYERLPAGRYTWKISWSGRDAAHVELTVRW